MIVGGLAAMALAVVVFFLGAFVRVFVCFTPFLLIAGLFTFIKGLIQAMTGRD